MKSSPVFAISSTHILICRRPLLRAVALPLLALLITMAESLSAATITWTGAAAGSSATSWLNRTNWDTGTVPGLADDVVIGFGTVFLPQNAQFASLTINGATLQGQFTNSTVIKWTSGVIDGQVDITASGVLDLSGDGQKNLSNATVNNGGTIHWDGNGNLLAAGSAVINNQAGGTFEARSDSALGIIFGGVTFTFNNAGLFRKSGGTNATTIQSVTFNNSGQVQVQTGTVAFPTGLTTSGVIAVSAGAKVEFQGGQLALQSGSTITGAGFYGVTGTVDVSGTINSTNFQLSGTLTGTNTISGRVSFTSGVISGQVTIAAGGVLDLTGDAQKNLSDAVINNNGTIHWSGNGNFMASGQAVLNNQAGAVFEAQSDAALGIVFGGVPFTFNNAGLFRKSGGTNVTAIQSVTFNNSGQVQVQTGTIAFPTGLTTSGVIDVSAGTRVEFEGGQLALQSGSTITGAGFYGVTGTVDVSGTINSTNFQLSGTLTGTNTISGRVNFTSGVINGHVSIVAGAVLDLTGDAQKNLSDAVINNNGTIHWSGNGNFMASGQAVLNNQAGAVFEAQSDAALGIVFGGVPFTFNNAGLFRKSGGTNVTAIQSVTFNNSGQLQVQTGTIAFPTGLTTSGVIAVSPGARVEFQGGQLALQSGSTITGAGFYGVTGTVDVSGTINSTSFQLSGTLTGTNTISGRVSFTSGVISGQVNIAAGGVLDLTGDVQKNLSNAVINNSGTIRWNGSGNFMANGSAVINNQAGGVIDAQSDATLGIVFGGVPFTVNNAGLFQKSGGSGLTSIQSVGFTNTGTVAIESGTLSFSGDYTQAAGTLDLRGGALAVSSSVNINGGVLSGSGTINGNVFNRAQVSPGAIQINGDYNQTSAGALKIAIAGISPGQFGALQVQGQASLAGSLNLALTNSFQPNLGDSFQVMAFSSRTGIFTNITGLAVGAGQLAVTFNPNSVIVSLPSPLTLSRAANGSFKIHFAGQAGVTYLLEASTDLVAWTSLIPGGALGTLDFTDTGSANLRFRFFRVRPL